LASCHRSADRAANRGRAQANVCALQSNISGLDPQLFVCQPRSSHLQTPHLTIPILQLEQRTDTMNAPRLLSRRTLSVCLDCRRTLLRQQRQISSTPTLAVAAFQSYTLPSQPPAQPRNAAVPDTSITQPVEFLPRVHETRPPPDHPATPAPAASISEQAAQTSRSSFASPASATQQPASSQAPSDLKPAAKPRSKLRAPRKAAMKLTPAAVDQLRTMFDQPDPKLVKIGVRNRGCSGLAYHLEYVDKAGTFDEAVEQDGVRVLIDSKALFSIIGSEMDWVEDKLSQKFVFRNPNISEYSPFVFGVRIRLTGAGRGAVWMWRVVYGMSNGKKRIEFDGKREGLNYLEEHRKCMRSYNRHSHDCIGPGVWVEQPYITICIYCTIWNSWLLAEIHRQQCCDCHGDRVKLPSLR